MFLYKFLIVFYYSEYRNKFYINIYIDVERMRMRCYFFKDSFMEKCI